MHQNFFSNWSSVKKSIRMVLLCMAFVLQSCGFSEEAIHATTQAEISTLQAEKPTLQSVLSELRQTQTAMAISFPTPVSISIGGNVTCPFYVYQDWGNTEFTPGGFMGDISDIGLNDNFQKDPERPDVIKITYTPTGGQGFSGIYWWVPGTNWGNSNDVGLDISCASKLMFWARGEKGGEKAEFKVGGINGAYSDSLLPPETSGPIVLTTEWAEYIIDLTGKDLSHIMGGFVWVTNKPSNPDGATIYLDDIRFDNGSIINVNSTKTLASIIETNVSIERSLTAIAMTQQSLMPIPTATYITSIPTPTFFPISPTTNKTPTQQSELKLQAAFEEIDNQFRESFKGNIAFNKPDQMRRDGTATIELILSPSLSESALVTQVIENSGLVTSTVSPNTIGTPEPSILIAPSGETVTVTTSQIEITPRMKAALQPQDPEAFTVTEMHDNAEQVVSSVETTIWRWSVTAKKEGQQTLELVIYQLVKYDGKEFWHEVETYKADIVVEVTLGDRVKSMDWKWIAATLLIPLIGGLWAWWKNRNKKAEVMQIKIVNEDEKKKSPKRKG